VSTAEPSPVAVSPGRRLLSSVLGVSVSWWERLVSSARGWGASSHSWDGYFGPTTLADTADRLYPNDLVVHRWDLAQPVG